MQFVDIVQGGIADSDATDKNWLEPGNRRQRTRPAHLKFDVKYRREFFFGGKLVCHRPTRSAGDKSQLSLLTDAIDFVDNSVDFVCERVAL